jgi:hypothetical protein
MRVLLHSRPQRGGCDQEPEAMKTRQKIRLDAIDQRIENLERRGNEEWIS